MADLMVEEFSELIGEAINKDIPQKDKILDAWKPLAKEIGKEIVKGSHRIPLIEWDELGTAGPVEFSNHDLYSFQITLDEKKPYMFKLWIDIMNKTNNSFKTADVGVYNILNKPSWSALKASMNKKYLEVVAKIVK